MHHSREHVVLVLAGAVLGGAERNALELGGVLAGDGHARVSVCSLAPGDGRARQLAAELEIPWRVVSGGWYGSRARRLEMLARLALGLRRLRPDVLVTFTNLPNVACAITWRATGARLLIWNQCDVLPTTRFGAGTFRRALQRAPVVVTMAYHARDWLASEWGVDTSRVHVIRSLVELPAAREPRAAWRSRLAIGEEDTVGCMIAHFHAGKDHETTLRAWRHAVDALGGDGRNAVILLAGRDAGSMDAAKAVAYDLDLGRHVRFLGEVTDIRGLLDASDLALFCSQSECLGRGATEPMFAGLPVVGTDVPGIREAVGAPGVDLLAPPRDAGALARSVLRIARDAGLRSTIGHANAELIRRRQSREATTQVYARLMAALG